ncbi:MAG TPA: S41 family peptidase [Cytophagales bacterium]
MKISIARRVAVLLLLLAPLNACRDALVGPAAPNTPERNFEALWHEFDRLYGTFETKKVDWNALYAQYRPRVNAATTDRELLTVMGQLLDHLDDNHIYVRPMRSTGLPYYEGGILGRRKFEDFDAKVADAYVTGKQTYGADLAYGWLTPKVAYLKIKGFADNYNQYPPAMDKVLGELAAAAGMVVDLRDNGGGEDRVAQYIANRFASGRSLSFTSRLRNGPGHDDFGPVLAFYTRPEGPFQYTKPVVVLTRRATFSAGETFVLAMKRNPNVVTVGDSTGGAFSDAVKRELPNGWIYRVPIADVRAADGKNYESIGLAPDVLVQNTKEELRAGRDKALEKASELLSR